MSECRPACEKPTDERSSEDSPSASSCCKKIGSSGEPEQLSLPFDTSSTRSLLSEKMIEAEIAREKEFELWEYEEG